MTALNLTLDGHNGRGVTIDDEPEYGVALILHAESDDAAPREVSVDRVLAPDEARALAAALVHFADEVES